MVQNTFFEATKKVSLSHSHSQSLGVNAPLWNDQGDESVGTLWLVNVLTPMRRVVGVRV